jgi:pimeloyl-ACP methyl ester carboxylesterase
MRELIAANDPEAYASCALATARGQMTALETLDCPLLAFCGSEDPVTPPAAAESIASAALRGEVALVPGCAHWCMLEDPAATNQALFGFLDRHAPRH